MMKVLFGMLFLLGASHFDGFSQDKKNLNKDNPSSSIKYCIIDTILNLPDGTTGRIYFRSAESSGNQMGSFFSAIVKEFDLTQRQLVGQFSEETDKLIQKRNQWVQQQIEREAQMRQEFRTRRVALFSDMIGLTSDEAQRFWPVYNEYSAKREEILSNRKLIVEKIRNSYVQYTSKEAELYTASYINSSKQEADLVQEYYKRLKHILPPEKLLLLYRAEEEFKLMMLRSLRGN